jgi:hypothetical protein
MLKLHNKTNRFKKLLIQCSKNKFFNSAGVGGSKADTRKWSKNVGIYLYEDEKEKTPVHVQLRKYIYCRVISSSDR